DHRQNPARSRHDLSPSHHRPVQNRDQMTGAGKGALNAMDTSSAAPTDVMPGEALLARFFQDGLDVVCVEMDGRQALDIATPAVLVAGAFDPVHDAHWGLAAAARQLVG